MPGEIGSRDDSGRSSPQPERQARDSTPMQRRPKVTTGLLSLAGRLFSFQAFPAAFSFATSSIASLCCTCAHRAGVAQERR